MIAAAIAQVEAAHANYSASRNSAGADGGGLPVEQRLIKPEKQPLKATFVPSTTTTLSIDEQLKTVEAARNSQVVVEAASQATAAAAKQLGGGLGGRHMQAALRRQMEADQAAAAAAAAAAGGSVDHRLAEVVEAAQAQAVLERAPRFSRMSKAAKLVQQSSWVQMTRGHVTGPPGCPKLPATPSSHGCPKLAQARIRACLLSTVPAEGAVCTPAFS